MGIAESPQSSATAKSTAWSIATALGAEPRQRAERARREAELRRLREVQRQLGREPGKVQMRERQRGLGIAR
jgi:hypothetical protein